MTSKKRISYFKFFVALMIFIVTQPLLGQSSDEKLALQYALDGDCEKASILFKSLIESKRANTVSYAPYQACLEEGKDYDQAIKVAKYFFEQTQEISFQVDEGYYLSLNGDSRKADKLYDKLVDTKYKNQFEAIALSNALRNRAQYDLAIKVLEKNQEYILEPTQHIIALSQLYYLKGDKEESLELLLSYANKGDLPYRQVMANLPLYLNSNEDYNLLKKLLIKRIRTDVISLFYEEMLSWAFVQQKDWNSALIHYKSISKKKEDNGRTVLNLAQMCMSNKEYGVAIKCYEYVLGLGTDGLYYRETQSNLLSARYLLVVATPYPDSVAVANLERDFLSYIQTNKNNEYAAVASKQLAEIYIKQLHQPKKAIELLESAISAMTRGNEKFKAQCKLDLGDAYLFMGDVWESELLYSQVEKSFKEEPLGQEAKFRKARLAYYRGEFNWAETQLEVLKGATSQLISNNAIELALRIQDNLGLDSNYIAMEAYAKAELLLFQNKPLEAMREADKISLLFPKHSLVDEVFYLKARVYAQLKDWEKAIKSYNVLVIEHPNDILYDNALFELASIYEQQFKDTAKAMVYYEKLILEQQGSLFVVEASRRYRALRGDIIKEQENYFFEP